jgi:hypothetical protein
VVWSLFSRYLLSNNISRLLKKLLQGGSHIITFKNHYVNICHHVIPHKTYILYNKKKNFFSDYQQYLQKDIMVLGMDRYLFRNSSVAVLRLIYANVHTRAIYFVLTQKMSDLFVQVNIVRPCLLLSSFFRSLSSNMF